ncbi:replication protein A 14 kDa subunit [Scyliorhinus canicula]|uniref:replication protein A 14 kDa subunit n=1 Tax=Scyliorhinus canicula TaxID=7830 RepID=UPI0018F339D8|nr:replication protein A 14 kDa subunit [Scyliorhinus canicula]
MADILEVPRTRINTSLVSRFAGMAVCFVGRVQKVHPSGTSFVLADGDGKNVTVEMTDPLDEELSGVIEVVGKVTPKATIKAAYYVPFREDKNSFDLGLYNEALNIIHDFSQYYPFSVTASG